MPWDEVMKKFHRRTLKSSSGETVTNPKQAVAIEYSEKRMARKGEKEYQSKKKMKRVHRSSAKGSS